MEIRRKYTLLSKLPPPPHGKKGWPWTVETKPLAPRMPNGTEWPTISIITPSFNQGIFIEETIRSILLQNYPKLEFIIIDGGSTDETIEIIKKYDNWISYWISEEDRGQSHALNKGFKQSTGNILNWICSDDMLLANSLQIIAHRVNLDRPQWIIGGAYCIDERTSSYKKHPIPRTFGLINFLLWYSRAIQQPSVFWNRKLFSEIGTIREDLHFCMDTDLWFNFYKIIGPDIIQDYLSIYRNHENAKTTWYNQNHADSINELSNWLLKDIYQCSNNKIQSEISNALQEVQKDAMSIKRLRNHIVFGNLLRFWKRFINSSLPV